jgi:hypothetical protein
MPYRRSHRRHHRSARGADVFGNREMALVTVAVMLVVLLAFFINALWG